MTDLAAAETEARRNVNIWTTAGAVVGWLPLSVFLLVPADYLMIRAVAQKFGTQDFEAQAIIGMLVASLVGKSVAEVLAFGLSWTCIAWAIKPLVAAVVTKIVGEVAIAHFRKLCSQRLV